MSENLTIQGESKEALYANLYPQIEALLAAETDDIANMANLAACLSETFHFWWVGFYRVAGTELILGPFQGPLACTRIRKGRGVCGSAWQEAQTILVPDVDQFPGHIACSSASRSEIVVPIMRHNQVIAVLDIDCKQLDYFDAVDRIWLEKIANLFGKQ